MQYTSGKLLAVCYASAWWKRPNDHTARPKSEDSTKFEIVGNMKERQHASVKCQDVPPAVQLPKSFLCSQPLLLFGTIVTQKIGRNGCLIYVYPRDTAQFTLWNIQASEDLLSKLRANWVTLIKASASSMLYKAFIAQKMSILCANDDLISSTEVHFCKNKRHASFLKSNIFSGNYAVQEWWPPRYRGREEVFMNWYSVPAHWWQCAQSDRTWGKDKVVGN